MVKTSGYGKILKKEEGSRSRGYKELDVPSKPDAVGTVENDGIKNVRSRGIVPDTSTVPGRRQTSSNSTSKTSTVSSSKNISNDVLTSVKYLRSLLLSGNINTDALLLFNVQSVKEVAEKSYQSVEKISKFLKSDETNNLLGDSVFISNFIFPPSVFTHLYLSTCFVISPILNCLLLKL